MGQLFDTLIWTTISFFFQKLWELVKDLFGFLGKPDYPPYGTIG